MVDLDQIWIFYLKIQEKTFSTKFYFSHMKKKIKNKIAWFIFRLFSSFNIFKAWCWM